MLLNPILHPIPDVLNKIKIWRVRGELDTGNLSAEEVHSGLIRPVRRSIVLHEDMSAPGDEGSLTKRFD